VPGWAEAYAKIAAMLAALNFGAVLAGLASGALSASLLALIASVALTSLGMDTGSDIGLATGVFTGLAVGGWVAGSRSVHSHRFHGMVAGLGLAFIILVVAQLGGAASSLLDVIWLAVVSIAIAGLGGWLAGRRKVRGG